jgi:2,4-dienoyl-CoA reductase-like NADH-dependent reductase (Old Yellow Enzyme family)
VPRALAPAEIARVHEHFARAAAIACDAGFDGVELHGANGYLIDQFLTDYTNRRTDEYGGAVVNRIRFAVEALLAVCAAVPAGFPVGVRLSQHKTAHPDYTWPGGEADALTIFRAVAAAGASFVHVGGQSAPACAYDSGRRLCALAREAPSMVVIANGGLDAPDRARALIAGGETDLVSIARGALANSDWPHRVVSGLPLKTFDPAMIRPEATLDRAEAWRREQPDFT